MKLFEKQFFDYKTELVNGDDVVDKYKTGMSFYDDFLTADEKTITYLKNSKNLEGNVVMMSPEEYFEACSKYGFNNRQPSVETLKTQRRSDKDTLNHLKDVLTIYKHKFPMPVLNIAEHGQEGLHRMMVIGDMFGWNHKVPVLVIDWADKQRAYDEAERKRKNRIEYNIKRAVQDALEYRFNNIEELKEQIQWELDRRFEYNEDNIKVPVQFELSSDELTQTFDVKVDEISYTFEYSDILFKDEEISDDELIDELELEETEDFLKRYFGDDWRETHPHLKDIYKLD